MYSTQVLYDDPVAGLWEVIQQRTIPVLDLLVQFGGWSRDGN